MTRYLIDTSAWVELLRDTGSPACRRVAELLTAPDALVTTQPVVMEVLAGAPTASAAADLEALMAGQALADVDLATDFHAAAALYRTARAAGETVRSLVDCLVAVVALRVGAVVVHRDRDYDVLARVLSGLQVERS